MNTTDIGILWMAESLAAMQSATVALMAGNHELYDWLMGYASHCREEAFAA